MAHCEASAILLSPIDHKLLGHLFLSISLPHAKMQPHFPSNYLIMIFQSFCPERSFVKEVQARHIQMSFHFAWSSISSYHSPPKKLSSCHASMWAHLQFFVSVQIFSLGSKYILYCFTMAENFPGPSPIHITYPHKFWDQFIKPLFL